LTNEGEIFKIFTSGRHCEIFEGELKRDVPLHPSILQEVHKYCKLMVYPSRVLQILTAQANKKNVPPNKVSMRPTLAKIQNIYVNLRRNRAPDVQETQAILMKKKIFEEEYQVIFPKEEKDLPKPDKDWVFVISTNELMKQLEKYGKEKIHLDSIFKITTYRVPLWSVKLLKREN
jgi:hypothetical protein